MDENMATLAALMAYLMDDEGYARSDILAALDVAEAMIDEYYDELAKEENGRHPS